MGLTFNCSVFNRFDIVIRNGLILDGNGGPGVQKDLGIKGERIAAIDNLSAASANIIIDARDLVVAPGFIDIHTHTDTNLLIEPRAESKIHQGVTTEVGGNCGSSPFPLSEKDRLELHAILQKEYAVPVTWHDLAGFFHALVQKPGAVNFATFTGHGSLRALVVGKNDLQPTSEQLRQMKKTLTQTLEMGSFGLSTGLEYAPGSYAATSELIELARVVAQYSGIYATHIRNEDDHLETAIQEALQISKVSGARLEISHLKACNQNNWPKIDNVLELLHTTAAAGLPVHADRYPYIAYATGLISFLPLWARQGGMDEILGRLNDHRLAARIQTYAESRGQRIGGWERVVISSCVTDQNKIWEGKSIQAAATTFGKTPFDFIREMLMVEKGRAGIVGFAMSENNLKKVLSSPLVMIASDGNAVARAGKLTEGKPHPRYFGTFPRVLGRYVRDEKILNLPTAIQKMTSLPARKLGLRQRGSLEPGCYADITIFNPRTVIDNATFVEPLQFPTGIEYVIVNGKITIRQGQHTGATAGRILRRGEV